MRMGIFYQAGKCAVLSFLGYENAFFFWGGGEEVPCFSQFYENAVNKGLK